METKINAQYFFNLIIMRTFISSLSIFFCFLIIACNPDSGNNDMVIVPDAFETKLKSEPGVQLIDVRTQEEFQSGHLDGALNWDIQNGDFQKNLASLDKNKAVLVYCAVGGRSATAAKKLHAGGYSNVYDLKGGIKAWKAAGKPVAQ
jgi:rhodanese-related sulfurtransferase